MSLPPNLIERRFHVTRAAIRRYADASQDYNPIHLDPEFAAKTPMGGIIAHGMLSLSLVWQSLAKTFGVDRIAGVTLDIRFVRPVREDDWVIAGGTLKDEPGNVRRLGARGSRGPHRDGDRRHRRADRPGRMRAWP